MANNLSEIIQAARGDKESDLLLTNGKIINVFSGDVQNKSIAVSSGHIVGFGDCRWEYARVIEIVPNQIITRQKIVEPLIKNHSAQSDISRDILKILPIAGLMSSDLIENIKDKLDNLVRICHDLGATLKDPFMTLSFLALPVVPDLKLTDKGLVEVGQFGFVLFLYPDPDIGIQWTQELIGNHH